MSVEEHAVTALIDRACEGDQEAFGELFSRYRQHLARLVSLRMDRRLQGRVDQSDVIQEAFFEASTRLPDYREEVSSSFYLWLRFLTLQRLMVLHRRHLGAKARDASRELSLHGGPWPQATSESLASQLLGRITSPSHAAVKAELRLRLQEVLNQLDPLDREVLTLRHFEQLSNSEAAQVLGVHPSAASSRYVRAMRRPAGAIEWHARILRRA